MRTCGDGGGVGGVVGGVVVGVVVEVVAAVVAVVVAVVSGLAAVAACRVARGAGGCARAHTDILQDIRGGSARRPHTHQTHCNARQLQLHNKDCKCE